MKKLLIVLAFAGVSVATMAQSTDAVPTQKYSVATNSFWSNWFLQVGGQWSAWYSNEEHDQNLGLSKSPFKKFRSGPVIAIAVGKWFCPEIGLRTKVSGIWGKTVSWNDQEHSNKYWMANEQVLINLSNIICGYNPNRVWNFIPFAGAGITRTCTYDLYAMNLNVGILNEFYISKKIAVNLEFGYSRNEGDADGVDITDGKRGWNSHDNNFYGEVGLTFNLGKKASWEKAPDVAALQALSKSQLDALNAQLNDQQAENSKLKDMLAQKPAEPMTKSIKEFVTTPISVFFNLDKIDVASKKDLVNVEALAKYAKENNSKILVTGYADSATGSEAHNKTLSENRANQVADELVKMGVSRDKITTAGNGGVKTLSPVSFNRRATVQITD